MTTPGINIVWLKRDLRLQNHAALHAAEKDGGPYRIIYLFEPSLVGLPDTSLRHLQFVFKSIEEMNRDLLCYNRQVDLFYGDAQPVFEWLLNAFHVRSLFSHQESGIQLTWNRDKQVKVLLDRRSVSWKEFQRDGIVRGITHRKGWDKQWFATMLQPPMRNEYSSTDLPKLDHPFPLPHSLERDLLSYPAELQTPGENAAHHTLKSFAEKRGFNYSKGISKPQQSRESCSRLSAHLAWGNLSIQQTYHFIKHHPNYAKNKRSFSAFLMRLKWHCHFIQKFEVECSYETQCVNRGYESLERTNDPNLLKAWKAGQTGLPLVDALMRCLAETGWINFRMRAMLVSVLCHHFDQDWRNGAHHLSQLFLDYEPGIHYTQFQMQAGTTGTNTVRIYNPVKQSIEHDPDGQFIKQWVPELRGVPVEYIHEPWKMDLNTQSLCRVILGQDYPTPSVDVLEAARSARQRIWGHRKDSLVQTERQRILKTHTRNRLSSRKRPTTRGRPTQDELPGLH